jgi:hypothetical protein
MPVRTTFVEETPYQMRYVRFKSIAVSCTENHHHHDIIGAEIRAREYPVTAFIEKAWIGCECILMANVYRLPYNCSMLIKGRFYY